MDPSAAVAEKLESHELPQHVCNKEVTEVHLEEISRTCSITTQLLAPYLDMPSIVEEDIQAAGEMGRYKFFGE